MMKKISPYLFLVLILTACQVDPEDLVFETNYFQGLALGKDQNKPIFLYFSCYNCMGYDEFKNDFITSRKIQQTLNQDFITVQLYVDDPAPIQEKDTIGWHTFDLSERGRELFKKIKNIGQLNTLIEIERFQSASQPLYTIINAKQQPLIEPFGYIKKKRSLFYAKLQIGLHYFNQTR